MPRVPFRFGTPFGPQSELEKLSWPSLGTLLCPRTHSQDPLEAFQKAFRAKNEIVKICPGFPSEFVPWPTFAAPERSKRTPLGPDQLSRGPPGKPLERKTHLPRPSLSLPGKPIGLSLKKTFVFEKIAKTNINVRSGASWEKRAALQNRVFRFLGAPWSPPEPGPFRSRPPRSSPKHTLELPGPLQIPPRAPRRSKGPYQIHKVGMLKTLEICVFGLQECQKNASGRFVHALGTPRGPSRVATPILKGPPGCQKGPPGAPRDLSKITQEVPGPP